MGKVGRPPSCECGTCRKCRQRVYAREAYARLTLEQRREVIARRDPEVVRANDRARHERDREQRLSAMAERRRRWTEDDHQKERARKAVSNAVRDGRLQRERCADCGASKVEAHHEDYARPLDVLWLCPVHHGARHRVAVV